MKIKSESTFTPAPDGVHNAICVDVVDLGMVEGMYGEKHKLKIVWEIEDKMESGKPFIVSKRYTVSLHDKSTLRKDLKSWRGKDFTAEEMSGFELDDVIGVSCQLVVVHSEREGTVYSNVSNVLKAKSKLAPDGGYTRVKDRPDYQAPVRKHPSVQHDSELDKQESPF